MQEIIPFLTTFSLGAMVGLMVYVIVVNYRTWLGRACFGMCLTFGIWAISNYNVMTMDSEAARITWFQVSSLGWAFYPMAFLLFAMEVSKRGTSDDRRRLLLVTGTLGTLIVLMVMLQPGLFYKRFEHTRYGWGMTRPLESPVLLATFAYMLFSGFLQILWIHQWGRRTPYRQERHQSVMLVLAGLFVLITSAVTDIILPLDDVAMVPMTPIMSLAWFITLFYSAFHYHFLDITPSVAVGEVMTRIRDLMILLNRDGSVIQMNASARVALGYGMTEQAGLPLEQFLPNISLPVTDAPLETEAEMVSSRGARIPVQININPRYNDFNDLVGYIVTASDLRLRRALEMQRAAHQRMEDRFDDQSGIYKMILDHVNTGFLFFGSDQIIAPEFSRQCTTLFGREDLAGNDFSDMLPLPWDPDEKAHIRTVLQSIFSETRTWRIEALISLLPSRFDCGDRQIALQYRLVDTAPAGGRRCMLVMLDDRTDERLREAGLNHENTRLSMIASVLTNRTAFFELLNEYRNYFSNLFQSWKDELKIPREAMYDLYRNVHTFRGGFSRFGLKNTAEHLMQFEGRLSGLLLREVTLTDLWNLFTQSDPDDWIAQDMSLLKASIGQDFLQSHLIAELDQNILEGVAMDLEQQVQVSGLSPDAIRKVLLRFRELYCIHAKQMLKDYESYVKVISRERNLPEPVFVVTGSDVLLDGKRYRPFFRALIHIFNNIVAHAIETPEERAAKGKPGQARIECRVEMRQENMLIEIADDGCGIDREQIRNEMRIRKGMTHAEAEAVAEEALHQYIFAPGYSTALRADFHSGRGIGLFAVAHAVRQLGGTVSVQSELGAFTRFSFLLAERWMSVRPPSEGSSGTNENAGAVSGMTGQTAAVAGNMDGGMS